MLTILTEIQKSLHYLFNFTITIMHEQNCVTTQYQISRTFVQWLTILLPADIQRDRV